MTAKGHVLLAGPIAIGACMLAGFEAVEAATFLSAATLGSLLPDIDEPGSYIGRRTAGFSHLLSLFIKHRGPTHFLIAPTLIAVAAYLLLSGISQIVLFGVALGWFAHLLGDLLTKGGIRGFFYPFMTKKTIGLLPKRFRFYTGSMTEYLLMLPLAALNAWAMQVLISKVDLLGL